MPLPNGELNLWTFPVGQGEGNVLQCPGDPDAASDLDTNYIVIDMGTRLIPRSPPYIDDDQILNWTRLNDAYEQTVTVFLTHAHSDHIDWITDIDPESVSAVYIGGTQAD